MSATAQKMFDLEVPLAVLRAKKTSLSIPDLVSELRKKGISESDGRELIWRLLSLGRAHLTPDMTVCISRTSGSRESR
jgi:hypothetical protein